MQNNQNSVYYQNFFLAVAAASRQKQQATRLLFLKVNYLTSPCLLIDIFK
jgi:hypothetical protein